VKSASYSFEQDILDEGLEEAYDMPSIDHIVAFLINKHDLNPKQASELKRVANLKENQSMWATIKILKRGK
jgi:hypothetical protein